MALDLVTAPTVEPVTVEDVLAHSRISTRDEDALITRLIETARVHAEAVTRRAFINQTWDWTLQGWPLSNPFEVPKPPLSSVTSISYIDENGDTQTWASTNYDTDTPAGPHARPGHIQLAYEATYPTLRPVLNPVTVRFVAGYGAAATAVPAGIRNYLLALVGFMYDNRLEAAPDDLDRLVWPYRVIGFSSAC